MIAVAVFDLDGTLVDTPRGIVKTFTAVFEVMGLKAPHPDEIRATIGMPLELAFGTLMGLPAYDEQVTEGIKRYQSLFRDIVLPKAADLLFPGVADGLAVLRDQGVTLAVATSKFYASADALLTAAAIRDQFSVVVGADQVTHPKPHPESGQVVLRELDVPGEDTVMVGDTTHDLLMARACGMRSIAVTYGVHSESELRSAHPAWLADTFDDVLAGITAMSTRG
ncbi:HAD family hydrolase [Streptomyces formicae]|uniref:HAD family hydrolase n=1 Tax=Streptomyces formicae TaxID=1616117 RepID=A0ABY3WU28_9ACTN|nr:HAD family hydrolase [Streptomyces formicae]UNM16158.1 HAD family hydrolase [Streptomyces formicae]